MSGYNADDGIFTMLSYRDPHLARTTDIFEKALIWLKEGTYSKRDVEETIIQTCSAIDTPLSPAGKASVEFLLKRKGKTRQLRNDFRRRVIECTKEDLIKVAHKHFDSEPAIAAVTSEEIMKRDEEMMKDNPLSTHLI